MKITLSIAALAVLLAAGPAAAQERPPLGEKQAERKSQPVKKVGPGRQQTEKAGQREKPAAGPAEAREHAAQAARGKEHAQEHAGGEHRERGAEERHGEDRGAEHRGEQEGERHHGEHDGDRHDGDAGHDGDHDGRSGHRGEQDGDAGHDGEHGNEHRAEPGHGEHGGEHAEPAGSAEARATRLRVQRNLLQAETVHRKRMADLERLREIFRAREREDKVRRVENLMEQERRKYERRLASFQQSLGRPHYDELRKRLESADEKRARHPHGGPPGQAHSPRAVGKEHASEAPAKGRKAEKAGKERK